MESVDKTNGAQQEVNIPERFLKREQERVQALEKRFEERQDKEGDGFANTFNENYNRIKDMIADLDRPDQADENVTNGGMCQEKLREKFSELNKEILLLNRVILDAKIFLASYDMKAYNSKLGELSELCDTLEKKILPRKKFGFRKVEKTKINVVKDVAAKVEANDSVDFVRPQQKGEKNLGFYRRSHESLHLTCEEVNKKPISLSDIDNCVVVIDGNASAVHMNNISNCKIHLGPVSNSVHIENCSDSILNLACHQFRMHSSDNCRLYLHCGSQPVIEYCKGIGFAPVLNLDVELFQLSGLNEKNLWDQVQDFNWLSSEKSPNWYFINPINHDDDF